MPVDTSIPLSGQQINPMQSLASVVQTAGGIQAFKNAQAQGQAFQQQAEQGAQDLRERQHAVGVLKNIKSYQDSEGNIDYSRLVPDIMTGAPTTGAQYIQGIAQTQQSAASARKAVNDADAEQNQIVGNLLYSLKGKSPMMVHDVLTGVKEKYPNLTPAVEFAVKYLIAPTVQGSNSPNPQLDAALDQAGRMFQGAPTQQNMRTGQVSAIPTADGTQLVQLSEGAAQPQGAPIGKPFTPPNQIINTPTGAPAVVNTGTGQAKALNNGDAPMVSLPPGESTETYHALQEQRTAVQQQANQAPVLHDINREVKATLAKGVTTGQLGGPIAKLKSTLGIGSDIAEQGASDYDILGKMLERSALTAAQGMGPQTNAGLEAQIKANGSTSYNPTALKKIANLNDALVTGSEKYRDGLEKAIEANPNLNVFVKRKFDQQWAANADPVALRLLNAAKNGDKEEINDIFKTVGGPKSQQGQALRQKLMNLKSLSETGQLQ